MCMVWYQVCAYYVGRQGEFFYIYNVFKKILYNIKGGRGGEI